METNILWVSFSVIWTRWYTYAIITGLFNNENAIIVSHIQIVDLMIEKNWCLPNSRWIAISSHFQMLCIWSYSTSDWAFDLNYVWILYIKSKSYGFLFRLSISHWRWCHRYQSYFDKCAVFHRRWRNLAVINSLPLWKQKVSKIAISSLKVFFFYQNKKGGFDSKLSFYNIFVHITIIKSYITFFIYSHKKIKWVTKVGHRKTLLRLNNGKGHCWFIEAGRRLSCSNHNL